MKSIYYFLFAVIFILGSCKGGEKQTSEANLSDQGTDNSSSEITSADNSKRYIIKSGVIMYNGPMGVIQTLYFDDYGAKEVFTTELDLGISKTKETQIRVDGYQYSFKEGETTGQKTKWNVPATDYTKMDAEMMKKYKMKDHGTETLAGKECHKYSIEMGSTPMYTWIWNNIMIKTVTKMGNGEMVIEATKIEEKPVEASLFNIPENITFTEM